MEEDKAEVQTVTISPSAAWAPIVISVFVMMIFAGALTLAFVYELSSTQREIIYLLMGAVSTMAVLVVNYWMPTTRGVTATTTISSK